MKMRLYNSYAYNALETSAREVGQVADYCPSCRRGETFMAFEINIAKCLTCGHEISFKPGDYAQIVTGQSLNLKTLIATTHPNLPEKIAGRMALETKVQEKQPLNPDEQREFLIEQFLVLEGRMMMWNREEIEGSTSAWVGLAFLVLGGSTFALYDLGWTMPALIAVGVFAFGVTLWLSKKAKNRVTEAHRLLLVEWASRLQPLSPTLEELENIRKSYRIGQGYITMLKPQEILTAIEEAGAGTKG